MMRRRDEDGASLSKELKSFHSYANFAGGYLFALNPFICAIMSTLGLLVLRQYPSPSYDRLIQVLEVVAGCSARNGNWCDEHDFLGRSRIARWR